METSTISRPAACNSIRHKGLSAAVKALAAFRGKERRSFPDLDWTAATSIESGFGATTVTVSTLDSSAQVTLSGPATPASVCVGEQTARTIARTGVDSISILAGDDGPARVVVGGATFPAVGAADERHALRSPSGGTRTVEIAWSVWSMVSDAVAVAADDESSRYALGSVLLENADGRGQFVGTDGRRLHCMSAPVRGNAGALLLHRDVYGAIRKAAETIARAVTGASGKKLATILERTALTVETGGDDRYPGESSSPVAVRWSIDGATLEWTGTTVAGRFPRWRDVFPVRPDAQVSQFDAATLRDQVLAAAACTSEQCRGVEFRRTPGSPATIESRNGCGGEYSAPLAGDVAIGLRISLDPRFLRDAIDAAASVLPGAPIVMETTDKLSACILTVGGGCRADDGESVGLSVVLMPLAQD